jgi:hypothetical protein
MLGWNEVFAMLQDRPVSNVRSFLKNSQIDFREVDCFNDYKYVFQLKGEFIVCKINTTEHGDIVHSIWMGEGEYSDNPNGSLINSESLEERLKGLVEKMRLRDAIDKTKN